MLVSIVLFCFIANSMVNNGIMAEIDHKIADLIKKASFNNRIALFITFWGNRLTIIIIEIVMLAFCKVYKYHREAIIIFFAVQTEFILNFFLKNFFQRSRPGSDFFPSSIYGYSFPSGHAMDAACFYGILIYFSFIFIKDKRIKVFNTVFFSLLILLIGLSRAVLGLHYFSDILGGFCFGIFWASLWILLYKNFSGGKIG